MVTEYCDQCGITCDQPKDSSVLSQSISINDVINLTKLHSWHNQWHGSTGLRVYGSTGQKITVTKRKPACSVCAWLAGAFVKTVDLLGHDMGNS